MTLPNCIYLAIGGGLFVATILTTDWLEGTHVATINEKSSGGTMKTKFPHWLKDTNSTVQVTKKFQYSLRHLCVSIRLHYWFHHLKSNISELYKQKQRNKCYVYGNIKSQLPIYAQGEIKRYMHVHIYILCTVGLVAVTFALSIIDIFIPRSRRKSIVKCTVIVLTLFAAISGMIAVLLARIERSSISRERSEMLWKYGYSFGLACIGEGFVIFMLAYNVVEYYLRTRKQVSEDCEYLRAESYPLNLQ